jgi:hypothetical protein
MGVQVMDKLIINCSTGETEEADFTPEEIAQREYEASLPPVIQPTSLEERVLLQQNAIDFILMNF